MTEATPDQTLDLRGSSSPVPVVRAAKAMKALEAGSVLELVTNDPSVDQELRAWSDQTGHHLITAAEEDGTWRVLLRKGGIIEVGR